MSPNLALRLPKLLPSFRHTWTKYEIPTTVGAGPKYSFGVPSLQKDEAMIAQPSRDFREAFAGFDADALREHALYGRCLDGLCSQFVGSAGSPF